MVHTILVIGKKIRKMDMVFFNLRIPNKSIKEIGLMEIGKAEEF